MFAQKPVQKPKNKKKIKKYNENKAISETNIHTENNKNYVIRSVQNKDDLCNICLVNNKDGLINHGRVGHNFACYACLKKIKYTSNRCPICNVKISYITKLITA